MRLWENGTASGCFVASAVSHVEDQFKIRRALPSFMFAVAQCALVCNCHSVQGKSVNYALGLE